MHKDFKCLDMATDHIYASRDIVFDEIVFPLDTLHPNAGVVFVLKFFSSQTL
jgi:hypothetical protein